MNTELSKAAGFARDLPAGKRVLLVEDELLFGRAVAKHLKNAGHECVLAQTLSAAREALTHSSFSLMLLDLRLPDGSGLDLLAELRATGKGFPAIVLTAFGEVADAVQAMKLGASDYLKKPVDLNELLIVIGKAIQTEELKKQLDYSREREGRAIEPPLLLGNSAEIVRVRSQIEHLSAIAAEANGALPTVLILGETGAGKDVAARLLHVSGPRGDSPFVQVDCAALPRELIEAELFGHEKGAYTGASATRAGLIEAAEDGTFFLDEIGELPLELQAKLLNVIERRKTRRLGSVRERPVNARFIASTNRNLPEMISEGRFRADLYYRLNVITISMPPLRNRRDDIAMLARHYAAQTSHRYGIREAVFDEEALASMQDYSWRGNVRELKHLVERAVLLCHNKPIAAGDLALSPAPSRGKAGLEGMTLEAAERALIEHALTQTANNVSEAARRLGVSRMTLRYRMGKHGFNVSDDKPD